ncbi:MAG TPA: ClpX C4-type zinc finger protein [Gallionella sp.]|nr:ClpX C4-type zinc finger protein [Gallionella sp.]
MSNVIAWPRVPEPPERTCAFCKRPESACKKLIQGTSACICDECAVVAKDLLVDATSKEAACSPAE